MDLKLNDFEESETGTMRLIDRIKEIPIIDDHTHIFGTDFPEYEDAGKIALRITPESIVSGLSAMNMSETVTTEAKDNTDMLRRLWLELYRGRRTTFPARAATRMYQELFGFEHDEITVENAGPLVERIKAKLPIGTEDLYNYIGSLGNIDIWLCNHSRPDKNDERTTRGKFRWVPYFFPNSQWLNEIAASLGFEQPKTLNQLREVLVAYLQKAKERGAVAIKGGAFAYNLNRPFAPNIRSLERAEEAKQRLDLKKGDAEDALTVTDALTFLAAQASGIVGLPMQIHVGLIWRADGPTRIPEIMELTPLFHACPKTTFVVFHGGYPRTDDLAHVAATMTNVRAEFNYVPFWSGLDFSHIIGRWIDMIPNDRILYGSDCGGLNNLVHRMVTIEGLAEALEMRIRRGYLTERLALQIAANILRNNAIDTYKLELPKYTVD